MAVIGEFFSPVIAAILLRFTAIAVSLAWGQSGDGSVIDTALLTVTALPLNTAMTTLTAKPRPQLTMC